MTKQHFKALAEELLEIKGAPERRLAVEAVIRAIKRFNTNFDERKFRAACDPIPE